MVSIELLVTYVTLGKMASCFVRTCSCLFQVCALNIDTGLSLVIWCGSNRWSGAALGGDIGQCHENIAELRKT